MSRKSIRKDSCAKLPRQTLPEVLGSLEKSLPATQPINIVTGPSRSNSFAQTEDIRGVRGKKRTKIPRIIIQDCSDSDDSIAPLMFDVNEGQNRRRSIAGGGNSAAHEVDLRKMSLGEAMAAMGLVSSNSSSSADQGISCPDDQEREGEVREIFRLNELEYPRNPNKDVTVRRKLLVHNEPKLEEIVKEVPYENFDYSKVIGVCDNVIGYVPVPLGYAGPITLDGTKYVIPMATTEGSLVASTSRGCHALTDGVKSFVFNEGRIRNPIARFSGLMEAVTLHFWLKDPGNFRRVSEKFEAAAAGAKLKELTTRQIGRVLYFRFVATTGDGIGGQLVARGTEAGMKFLLELFPEMDIISCGGNFSASEKITSVNWVKFGGKSVIAEAVVFADVLKKFLKVTAKDMVKLNVSKNWMGSAMMGGFGEFNAHVANIVTAIFIATGQDTAQALSSSSCITLMETCGHREEDLHISVTMPTVECGTTGGGAVLPCQKTCLRMMGINGPNVYFPGNNARILAAVVAAGVLAGELSITAELVEAQLLAVRTKNRPAICPDGT